MSATKTPQKAGDASTQKLEGTQAPASKLKVKTGVKAGGLTSNHTNEGLVRASTQKLQGPQAPASKLKVKTGVKAGSLTSNHTNEGLVRARKLKGRSFNAGQ